MNPIRTRTLEVTVVSGENLCLDRNLVTENTFVVVRTESIRCWSTKMAKQGVGCLNTSWNEKLMVEMPLHAKSITFEVQCKTSKGMVRSIGLARIAISDVIPTKGGCSEVLSYRLRNWEGRRSGVINFSVNLKEEEEKHDEEDSMWSDVRRTIVVNSGDFKKPDIMGALVDHHHHHHHHHHHDMKTHNNGVLLGIPVWWNHPAIHV